MPHWPGIHLSMNFRLPPMPVCCAVSMPTVVIIRMVGIRISWLVILEAGGLTTGGTNFDAKTRRNSTDLDDIFLAHISGMDSFARALMVAADILEHSDYKKMRAERYASFDQGDGRKFEEGKLLLEDLRTIALASGEPKQISGKQELYEMIINQYI